ncbi:MAG TPA: methyltransferase domain-containing protein [Jatrophihabitans sp.]
MSAEVFATVLVPSLYRPFAELLVDALDPHPGSCAVDVASGPGTVARVIARRIGAIGRVYACDLDAAMLAATPPAEPGAAPIELLACPADALPLPDASVDALTCQQGLQFFPDRVAALAELLRVARPGARLAVAVWRSIDELPVYRALAEAAEDRFGTAGGFREAPFALGDPDLLRAPATAAGWTHAEVSPRDLPIEFGSVADVLRAFAVTPMADRVRALDAFGRRELEQALRRSLGRLVDTDGAVRSSVGAYFLTASA